jgi:hypothetical protein
MPRRLVVLVLCLAGLTVAPLARAGGPSAGVLQNGPGLLSADGTVRYVAVGAGIDTVLAKVRTSDGTVVRSQPFAGAWGLPLVASFGRTTDGLSTDGRTLVLGDATPGNPLRARSSFAVLDPRTLHERLRINLAGDFSFDALSPQGRTLYLIQHVDGVNLTRYVVRAYDLRRGTLLPGRVADRTQRGWVMNGYAVARTTSPDGRWVYTLYLNPGGYPFVHALDTVRSVAHCVGIPWKGGQNGVWNLRLALGGDGRSLAVRRPGGRTFVAVDTRTWRISYPSSGGFPWWTVGVAAGAAAVIALVAVAWRRRREEVEHEAVEGVRLPQGQVVV